MLKGFNFPVGFDPDPLIVGENGVPAAVAVLDEFDPLLVDQLDGSVWEESELLPVRVDVLFRAVDEPDKST